MSSVGKERRTSTRERERKTKRKKKKKEKKDGGCGLDREVKNREI